MPRIKKFRNRTISLLMAISMLMGVIPAFEMQQASAGIGGGGAPPESYVPVTISSIAIKDGTGAPILGGIMGDDGVPFVGTKAELDAWASQGRPEGFEVAWFSIYDTTTPWDGTTNVQDLIGFTNVADDHNTLNELLQGVVDIRFSPLYSLGICHGKFDTILIRGDHNNIGGTETGTIELDSAIELTASHSVTLLPYYDEAYINSAPTERHFEIFGDFIRHTVINFAFSNVQLQGNGTGGGITNRVATLTLIGYNTIPNFGNISNCYAAMGGGGGISNIMDGHLNLYGNFGLKNNSAAHDGGAIWTDDYYRVLAGDEVIFAENSADKAYFMTDPEDILMHNMQIHTKSFSHHGFQFAYNNYDISYTKGTHIVDLDKDMPTWMPTAMPTYRPTAEPTVGPNITPMPTMQPKPTSVPGITYHLRDGNKPIQQLTASQLDAYIAESPYELDFAWFTDYNTNSQNLPYYSNTWNGVTVFPNVYGFSNIADNARNLCELADLQNPYRYNYWTTENRLYFETIVIRGIKSGDTSKGSCHHHSGAGRAPGYS